MKDQKVREVFIELTCKRCNHKWLPRTKKPIACPQCKSRLWNKDCKESNLKRVESTRDDAK